MTDMTQIQETFQEYKTKLIQYFQDKENISIILQAVCQQFDELFANLYALNQNRFIKTAYGQHLDNIGEIVGIIRSYQEDLNAGLFGFFGDPTSGTFSSVTDSELGARWRSLFTQDGYSSVARNDFSYRQAIEAKVKINHGYGTAEEIIYIVQKLTNTERVRIEENQANTCEVDIYVQGDYSSSFLGYVAEIIKGCLPIGVKLVSIQNDPNFTYKTFSLEDDDKLITENDLGIREERIEE